MEKDRLMSKIKNHERVNDILLGPLERPALKWLAENMPPWVFPDLLTLVGIFGTLMIFGGYLLSNLDPAYLWLASFGFIVNWFGDSMDGTLARYRDIQRPKYGFFVDHVVDAFSQLLIFISLGLSPFVKFEIAAVTLIGYMIVSILVYIQTSVKGVFKISYGKLGPTEVRAIAILVNTYIYFTGGIVIDLSFASLTIFDLICSIIAVILFSIFIGNAIRDTIELAKIDPPKHKTLKE
jgi:phosphatidylglycerophosphate synthase